MTDPAAIELVDPNGAVVRFADLSADPLVVILVRYFGCLPCQAYLKDIDAAQHRFGTGVRVVAVGGSADYQARWLQGDQGVQMPLLLDPNQQVRALAGLGNLRVHQLLSPRGAGNYLRAMRRGLRPQKVTRDTIRSPGVAIFGPDLAVQWTYEGKMLGDYPTIDEVVTRARDATNRADP